MIAGDKPSKENRKDRVMQIEFPFAEDKKRFYDYCDQKGQTPAKVVRLLVDKYVKGEIEL
jgi:hypothetical protein